MFKKKIALKFFSIIPVGMLYMSSRQNNLTTDEKKPKEVCALLIGPSGAGKSTVGNFIFGSEEFESSDSQSNRSKEIIQKTKKVQSLNHGGLKVTLIDSVGFFNTEMTEKERLSQLIAKIKQVSSINKIILVYPYQKRMKLHDQLLIGALGYCIKFTSTSLLLVINQVEQSYNPFKKITLNGGDPAKEENLSEIRMMVKKYLKTEFDCIDINKYSDQNRFSDQQMTLLQDRLLESLLVTKPLNKTDIQDWDEFYKSYQKNSLLYHQQMKAKFENAAKEWENYFESTRNTLKMGTTPIAMMFQGDGQKIGAILAGAVSFIEITWNLFSSDKRLQKYHEEQIKIIENKGVSGDNPQIEQINTFLNQKSS